MHKRKRVGQQGNKCREATGSAAQAGRSEELRRRARAEQVASGYGQCQTDKTEYATRSVEKTRAVRAALMP